MVALCGIYPVSTQDKLSLETTVHSVSNGTRGLESQGRAALPISPCSSLCPVQRSLNVSGNIFTSLPLELRLRPNVAFSKTSSPPYALIWVYANALSPQHLHIVPQPRVYPALHHERLNFLKSWTRSMFAPLGFCRVLSTQRALDTWQQ